MALDKLRISALCFDVDGTLSDTDDQFVEKLTKLLSPVRFIFPSRDPKPFVRKFVMKTESPGNFVFGIPDRLGLDDEISALGDSIYRLGLGKEPKPFKLVPGVREMLTQLFDHYPMAVVSARGGRSTGWFLDQFELKPFFKCITTAQTCEHTKPYPDPIEWAAKQMGVSPEDCLMIGDTTVDILAAKAAGAQSIGVLCGFGERDELTEAGADLILEETSHLTRILI
ncbi:MAG: HAD family hydrolase [Anaerolineales bacterium]|nr:HAD family hydrolase [Chloroflexota bacterium]MBL6981735.1 HAD family hydrolase [Anaerolineales bacterium]